MHVVPEVETIQAEPLERVEPRATARGRAMSEGPDQTVIDQLGCQLATEIAQRLAAMDAPIDSELDVCKLCRPRTRAAPCSALLP